MNSKNAIVGPESFLLGIEADSKGRLFQTLSKKASELPAAQNAKLTETAVLAAIEAREEQASTALGGGLIFPHARLEGIDSLIAVIATLSKELDCEKPDDVPVRMACFLLIPESQPMEGLRFISAIAKQMHDATFAEKLLKASTVEEANELFKNIRINDDDPLRASDIMMEPLCHVTPDMQLKEATGVMMKAHENVVPVLDGRKLVGEISCTELFKLGIPDFFSHLKSVGFIRYFDPFEKYFAVEAGLRVKDAMHQPEAVFPPEATLIEIVFAISVQRHELVYIVSPDNELLGVIDQSLLLERIINL